MRKDGRYTLTRESCGYAKPRWVFRFCGSFEGQFKTKREAIAEATLFQKVRLGEFFMLSF